MNNKSKGSPSILEMHTLIVAKYPDFTKTTSSTTRLKHKDKLPPPGKKASSEDEPEGCVSLAREWCKNTFRRKVLHRKLPILEWAPEYNTSKLVADMIAGLTVGLTLLPQCLAYATIARVPPTMGLYSAFVGSFVYIFFGSTKAISIGPTAGLAIACIGYTENARAEYTILLGFLLGLVTFILGVLQLGFLVNFISIPTLSGFTSAVALTICSTQIKALLGLNFQKDGFINTVQETIGRIEETQFSDAVLSLLCILTLIFLQNIQAVFGFAAKSSNCIKKLLWFLCTARSGIVVIVCTVVSNVYGDGLGVNLIGEITAGLPMPSIPPFTFTVMGQNGTETNYSIITLLQGGGSFSLVVIPLLAVMEHITIAKACAGSTRVDATQEMLTIGLSNLCGSFFGSIPVTGSFSYTAVNHLSGVRSPLGCLASAGLILLSLQFLTPYFSNIPTSTLASVIICSVIMRMDFGILRSMWNSKRMDILAWGGTFFLSILIGLEYGIIFGFLISIFFLLYYAAWPGISVQIGESSMEIPFVLVHLDRSLVYPSVERTCYILRKVGHKLARGKLPVVIDCKHIQFADFTAAQGIKDLFALFNDRKESLILWRLKPSVVRMVTGVMCMTATPFRHCSTREELDDMLNNFDARNNESIELEDGEGATNTGFHVGPDDEQEDDCDSDFEDEGKIQKIFQESFAKKRRYTLVDHPQQHQTQSVTSYEGGKTD